MRSPDALLQLLRKVKMLAENATNIPLSYEIQQEIVDLLLGAEKRMRDLRRRLKFIRNWNASHRHDRERRSCLKSCHAQLLEGTDDVGKFISILRDVGDSLAFIYLNRWDIRPFLSRPHAGHISGKAGLQAELRLLRILFENGQNALLNDITNCMRVGDITLFLDAGFVPIEVKSSEAGKASERAKRQLAAGERIMQFLAEDRVTGLYHAGETVYRVASHSEPTDHTGKLDQILRSYNGGWVREEVEPGLHYIVVDDPDDLASKGNFAPDRKLRGYMVNEFKQGSFGHYPFPLSFRDPIRLLRFYGGAFIIFVVFDLGVIDDALRNEGFEIDTNNQESRSLRIRRITGEPLYEVTEQFIWRFVGELLTLEWFIERNSSTGAMERERVELSSPAGWRK
jgi:hypothetical protein